MKIKIHSSKSSLLIFVVVLVLMATTSCGKPGSSLNWYPEAERIEGKMNSSINYEIITDPVDLNETVVIEDRDKPSSGRWWVDVECDYWARCFMRCDGPKQKCWQLAEDSNFTVNSISPF